MKIGKYLSLISILIAIFFVIKKILFDLETYKIITAELESEIGDAQPTLVSGGIKVALLCLIPMLLSLILSIIGMKRKNKFGKIGLTLNIITIVYLLIPLGLIISTQFWQHSIGIEQDCGNEKRKVEWIDNSNSEWNTETEKILIGIKQRNGNNVYKT